MSKSKGKRFVLPKPSNNEDLNTDFSSRLKYYDDEKRGILNIVIIKPRPSRKSSPKSAPKTPSKTSSKTSSKTHSKRTPKTGRVASRT
jgi:hypothetical protein